MMKFLQSKVVRRASLLLAILNVLFIGGRQILIKTGWITPPRPFERQAWLRAGLKRDENRVRLSMMDDLRAHYLCIGMTRAEVVALLGRPDNEYGQWMSYALEDEALKMCSSVQMEFEEDRYVGSTLDWD